MSEKKLEFFDYRGDFTRHLIFEKGIFLIAVAVIICAGLVFIEAVKSCGRSIDKYNNSIVNLYKSIDPSELVAPQEKGKDK